MDLIFFPLCLTKTGPAGFSSWQYGNSVTRVNLPAENASGSRQDTKKHTGESQGQVGLGEVSGQLTARGTDQVTEPWFSLLQSSGYKTKFIQ